MDMELAKRRAVLKIRKERLDAALKQTNSEISQIDEQLLTEFALEGSPGVMSFVGEQAYNITVGKKPKYFAGPDAVGEKANEEDWARACKAMKDSGYGVLVHERFDRGSAKALAKEIKESGREYPPEWEGAIKVTEKDWISVTLASSERKPKKKKADPSEFYKEED